MDITIGDTFLYESPANKKHLYVVVTGILETGCCLCVFISSIKPNTEYDGACVLHEGDFSFIKHDSYVVYDKMRPFVIDTLSQWFENGTCIRKGKASQDVLDRIVAGAKESEYTPNGLLKYF